MNIMQGLQNMLNQASSPQGQADAQAAGRQGGDMFGGLSGLLREASGGGRSGLLGPAALGGLLGAMFSSDTARTIAGGALLAGGGAALWNKYKERVRQSNAASPAPLPAYGQPALEADADGRALRLVRALVFAARSDGHIDDAEQRAIQSQLQRLNLGPQAQQAVSRAMSEPLDPALIAGGVQSVDEALEVFTLSCAVIDADQFMEKAYLDGLGRALNIPADVRDDMIGKMRAPA